MAFFSILLMLAFWTLLGMIILGVLSLKGVALLVVGIIFLKKNKKAEKRIVAPVISIVLGGIFLLPLALFILWWIYGIVTRLIIQPEVAAAILRI